MIFELHSGGVPFLVNLVGPFLVTVEDGQTYLAMPNLDTRIMVDETYTELKNVIGLAPAVG